MAALCLCRLTNWGLGDVLDLTWTELQDWLEDAIELEKQINARK